MVQGPPVIHAQGPGDPAFLMPKELCHRVNVASGLETHYDLVEFNQDRGYASAVEHRSSDRCR